MVTILRRLCPTLILICLLVNETSAANIRFAVIGDFGIAGPNEQAVATMIDSWHVDFILTAGDNSYGGNPIDQNIGQYYHSYIGNYIGSYGAGADSNCFFPTLGNHDYTDGGGITAHYNYFTLPGNERYYSLVRGSVQFFMINSNSQEPDGIASTSAQALDCSWNLRHTDYPFRVAVMHHAPYSSCTTHGSTPVMQWPFEQWGVDVVIAGHDHTYERIMVDNDHEDDSIPYFVNGLGGRSIYSFPSSGFVPGSAVRYNGNYGAMLVDVTDTTMLLQFYSISGGGTLVDSVTVRARPGCCQGKVGNVNLTGIVDLADLSALISYLTGAGWPLPCPAEANINNSGIIDLSDLTALVSYLTGGGFILPDCP
ncbi:alkaline phosphatase [candidate division GN15 bacterium]|uniref:Alkaline phosphatase n=1 Tax=candidate division GN15 bacterium TaxID=2072418 RepID=A0A855X1J1_9BACT|nr:MAG: alkaline phosphatase [candidate division GN15 bacterium]